MKNIAVLLTAHNRKVKTLDCLDKIFSQQSAENFVVDIFLTDDGCTDGTREAIEKNFPTVHIIDGDGTLFWNRGMHSAWKTASKTKDYDFYLWLNDDTLLYEYSLKSLIESSNKTQHKSIIVGKTCSSSDPSIVTYGGRNKNGLIENNDSDVECEFFNGNIVLVPVHVFNTIGMNDPIFHHSLGDFDYGKRASKKGIRSIVTAKILGICDVHTSLPTWCNPRVPFSKRWISFRTPLGNNPEEFFLYEKRHNGLPKALFHYFTNHLRVIYPKFW